MEPSFTGQNKQLKGSPQQKTPTQNERLTNIIRPPTFLPQNLENHQQQRLEDVGHQVWIFDFRCMHSL